MGFTATWFINDDSFQLSNGKNPKKKIGTLKEIKSMNFWKEDYALIYPKVPFEKNNSVITKKE